MVWERNSRNANEYWLLYNEDGSWRADHYVQRKDDLQDRVEQQEFATQAEAQKFIQSRTSQFTLQTNLTDRNQDKVGRVFPQVNRQIWAVTQQWTAQWEVAFEQWYHQQFHPSYFVQYNIPTDCADAAYAARWILLVKMVFPLQLNWPAATS
jgi:hypothetical protein